MFQKATQGKFAFRTNKSNLVTLTNFFFQTFKVQFLATDSDMESIKPSFKCLNDFSGQQIHRNTYIQGLKYHKSDQFIELWWFGKLFLFFPISFQC